MLAQQRPVVIAAFRRAHQCMRVAAVMAGVGQRHAGPVIELDDDHRAIDRPG